MPLTETKVFKLSQRPRAGRVGATFRNVAEATGTGAAKKKSKSAKVKPKSQPSAASAAGGYGDVVMDVPGDRTAWLVDDMLNTIWGSVQHLEEQDVDAECVDKQLMLCLEFAFAGDPLTKISESLMG